MIQRTFTDAELAVLRAADEAEEKAAERRARLRQTVARCEAKRKAAMGDAAWKALQALYRRRVRAKKRAMGSRA